MHHLPTKGSSAVNGCRQNSLHKSLIDELHGVMQIIVIIGEQVM